jgi:hypothetical protein
MRSKLRSKTRSTATTPDCRADWPSELFHSVADALADGFSKSSFISVTTEDFIAQLRRAAGKPLIFVNLNGDSIHRGYPIKTRPR